MSTIHFGPSQNSFDDDPSFSPSDEVNYPSYSGFHTSFTGRIPRFPCVLQYFNVARQFKKKTVRETCHDFFPVRVMHSLSFVRSLSVQFHESGYPHRNYSLCY